VDNIEDFYGYDTILSYIKDGVEEPSNQSIVNALASQICKLETMDSMTKDIHIWYLFAYESELYNHFNENSEPWLVLFHSLAKEDETLRHKILSEALLTTSRNMNRSATSYFFRLIEMIMPTDDELLSLQNELFVVLSSQHSKPINQSLKYLKRIHKDPSFNLQGFIEQIPILLSWDVKAVVNGTLSLTDALMRQYPENKKELALFSIQTLAQQDEALQTKAIKLLIKHKLLDDSEILDEIAIYQEGLFHSTRELLPSLNIDDTLNGEQLIITPPKYIREDNRIPSYESFDEMVFFFSQVFEGNNVYDFDLFIANLIKVDRLITQDNISKLDTVFQKAFKLYKEWRFDRSEFYFMMACLLIEYASILSKRFLSKALKQNILLEDLADFIVQLNKNRDEIYNATVTRDELRFLGGAHAANNKMRIYRKNPEKLTKEERAIFEKRNRVHFGNVEKYLKELKEEEYYDHMPLFDFENIEPSNTLCYLFARQCRSLLKHLNGEKNYFLLSTPTHLPSYIDTQAIISRFDDLQRQQADIDPLDMQMALSRWVWDREELEAINSLSSGEIKDILLYMTSDISFSLAKVIHPKYWLVALLRKGVSKEIQLFLNQYSDEPISYNLFEMSSFQATREPWEYEEWEGGNKVKKIIMSPRFRLERRRAIQNSNIDSIYRYMKVCETDDIFHVESNYGLLLSPALPYIFLENILAMLGSSFISAPTKKSLQLLFHYIINIWNNFGDNIYLFITYMMILEDKTIRTLSAELWIKATSEGTMNHQLLGETLGKLELNEYAPLKRFTDLIVVNILNISTLHNKSLAELLSAMIPQMNDEPIKGTKKLLEIYLEILSLTQQKPSSEVLEKLGVWGGVKSLTSVVNKIRKV